MTGQPKSARAIVPSILRMMRLVWETDHWISLSNIAVVIAQGVIPISSAWIAKSVIDLLAQSFAVGSTRDLFRQLIVLLTLQAGLMILSQLLVSASGFLKNELSRKLQIGVQTTLYTKISSFAGISYFETPALHDTFRVASQGAQFGTGQALSNLLQLLQGIIVLVSFLGVLIRFSPLSAAMVTIAVLPQLYAQLKFGQQRFGLAMQLSPQERRSIYYSQLLAEPSVAKEIRLFGLADFFLVKLVRTMLEVHRAQRRQEIYQLRWDIVLNAISTVVSTGAFVLIVFGAFAGRLSLGDVTLYISAVGSVQGALTGAIFSVSSLSEGAVFYTTYSNLLSMPQPIKVVTSGCHVPSLRSAITFQNVSFRYTDDHPWVLRNVNLTIPAGRCLALVGLNGAGKTTLVKLLSRLYDPTEGYIVWDGLDIREFDPAELRSHMGAIFQDFMRYDLTAQENIGIGDVERLDDMARIEAAAQAAGVHDVLVQLPQGYQSILSRWLTDEKTGIDLSGGEWQKVAIARMFMREADLLILDEPTAALDAESEYEIYSRFAGLVAGRTSLLISHRFSTIRMADIIAVLENGRITECGTHQQLMMLAGTYTRLYSMQAEQYQRQ